MPCKIVFFYNIYDAGFSETYYTSGTNPRTVADSIPNSLYQAAAKFRFSACMLKAVRISTYEVTPRKSLLIRPYPKAQGTRFASGDKGPDVASTTAVLQLVGSQELADRRIWLRGLSDLDVKRDEFGNDEPSAEIWKMWTDFVSKLKTANMCIRFLQRPPDAGLTWGDITKVAVAGAENITKHCVIRRDPASPPFTKGAMLSFRGIGSGLPRFPRQTPVIAKVIEDGGDWAEIAYALPGGVSVFPDKLQYTTVLYELSTISNYEFERFGEHKTGRPFGSLRGRTRAIRSSV